MNRELDDPTEALGRVFKDVIEPRTDFMAAIVSALTGLETADPRLLRAIVSVQAQCLMFARPMPARTPPVWREIGRDIDAAADHIAEFSLAGLRALAERHRRP